MDTQNFRNLVKRLEEQPDLLYSLVFEGGRDERLAALLPPATRDFVAATPDQAKLAAILGMVDNEAAIADTAAAAETLYGMRPCVDSCEASRVGWIRTDWLNAAGCDANQTCSCTSGTCGGATCGGSTCSATCTGDSCGNTCGDSCGYTTNLEAGLFLFDDNFQVNRWR